MNIQEVPIVSFLKDVMRRRKRLPSQLAADLGVSHATVSRWLSGKKVPNIRSCRRLAEYSAFIETDLDLILRSRGIRTLIMSGVATDVCVEMTAKVGFLKDYYIVLLRDLTATVYEESHNHTLRNIDLFYGEVIDSSDVVKCWKKGR